MACPRLIQQRDDGLIDAAEVFTAPHRVHSPIASTPTAVFAARSDRRGAPR